MQTYSCPSCGAEVKFQSSVSMTCVCPFCRSLIVRHDKNVESIGKMADLPDDISPFQIGTEGVFRGTHFGLIGRTKVGWEDGYWNEWFLYMDSGKRAWLAEAQGFLAISFEEPLHAAIKDNLSSAKQFRLLKLGEVLTLAGKSFSVADLKETVCVSVEGELPFVSPAGLKTLSLDLISPSGDFASIECNEDGKEARLYIGEYVEFNQLRFSNLRELPGWKMQPSPNTTSSAG